MDTYRTIIRRYFSNNEKVKALDNFYVGCIVQVRLMSEISNSALTLVRLIDVPSEGAVYRELVLKLQKGKKQLVQDLVQLVIALGLSIDDENKIKALEDALKVELDLYKIR